RGNVDGPDSGERTDQRRTSPLAPKSGRCATPCARLYDLASVPSRQRRAERGPRAMTQTRGDLRRFDPEAVHAKYEEERGKRMVAGRAEIRDLTSERAFAHYLEDPFTPYARRDPLSDDVDVAIVGAGIAGVVAGAKLREAGIRRIRIVDVAGGIGGGGGMGRDAGGGGGARGSNYIPGVGEGENIPQAADQLWAKSAAPP